MEKKKWSNFNRSRLLFPSPTVSGEGRRKKEKSRGEKVYFYLPLSVLSAEERKRPRKVEEILILSFFRGLQEREENFL